MMGPRDIKVQHPVYSPMRTLEINTVNKGAELLTVSVNETATNLRATNPSTTVENLEDKKINMS